MMANQASAARQNNGFDDLFQQLLMAVNEN
jgi:hypothetical protein